MSELSLKQEVQLLRSALIGQVIKDGEGNYRPEFVSEMLASLDRKPTKTFKDPNQFLEDVNKS